MSLNIQCLRSKYDELEVFLDSQDISIDILCLSEHWLKKEELACKFDIGKMQLVAGYARKEKKNGGVCIYLNRELNYQIKSITNIECFNVETIFECCAVEIVDINIIVLCVYRSPSHLIRDIEEFLESLNKCLDTIFKPNKRIILCGDFNLNIMKDNTTTDNFKNMLLTFNMNCTIIEPTRITASTLSCIDNVITNITDHYNTRVSDCELSDHKAIIFQVYEEKINNIKSRKYIRRYSEENIQLFLHILSLVDWNEILKNEDPNLVYNDFIETFLHYFDVCFPKLQILISDNNNRKINNNWITPKIKMLSDYKRNMYMLIKSLQKQSINVQNLKLQYKNVCINLKKQIYKQKQAYFDEMLGNAENKTKTTWQIVNKACNKHKKHAISEIKILDNIETITNPYDIANEFNEYFTNITKSLNLSPPVVNWRGDKNSSSFFLRPTDEVEVFNICMALKNKKSVGWDQVPVNIVKRCAHIISLPISNIINKTFEHGRFPDEIKKAIIVPIFKKGDEKNISNYRPVSILCNFSKIFEKAINTRLCEFLNKFEIITEAQHGYINGRTINLSIFKVLDSILKAWNNKIPMSMLV